MLCLASLVTFGISRKNETILLEVFYCTKCWAVLERAHVGLVGFAPLANEISTTRQNCCSDMQANECIFNIFNRNVSIVTLRSCMQKLFHCDLRPGKPLSASGRALHAMDLRDLWDPMRCTVGISRVWFCGTGMGIFAINQSFWYVRKFDYGLLAEHAYPV